MTRSTQFRPHSNEVLFASQPLVTADCELITLLKARALANARKRMRFCAHQDVQDALQEMVVVHTRDTYVRPHKHPGAESFHIIEGTADVILFDDEGQVTEAIAMGAYGSGRPFFYRVSVPCFHSVIIRSDIIVFHEAKNGPFRSSDAVFPSWAPDGEDARAVQAFLERLNRDIAAVE